MKPWNLAFRKWLCKKFGHMFYVGASGYYKGMPQAHCWRCGKTEPNNPLPDIKEPLGRWFS